MGFKFDVEKILKECPTKRQTMLFSATISPDIDYLANKYTKDAQEVAVKSHVDPTKLKQVYYDVPDNMKFSLFVHLLKKEKSKLIMIFCGTRRNVDFVTKNLINLGLNANAIHGGLNQNQRNRVLKEFNDRNRVNILVCTDVAARGLDIPGVSHVYNYDMPKTSAEYIHRIGRTARAGKEGIAISILCSRDYENFSTVTHDEKIKIQEIKTPFVERVRIIMERKSFGRRSRPDRPGRQSTQRHVPQRRTGGFQRGNSRSRDSSRGRSHNSRGPSRGRPGSNRPSSHRKHTSPGRNFKKR
jgi:ATP-dependent RNA helicase DeaD